MFVRGHDVSALARDVDAGGEVHRLGEEARDVVGELGGHFGRRKVPARLRIVSNRLKGPHPPKGWRRSFYHGSRVLLRSISVDIPRRLS